MSRKYNRRAGDEFYSLQGPDARHGRHERRGGGEIVLALYKALYQASKRRGFTHWLDRRGEVAAAAGGKVRLSVQSDRTRDRLLRHGRLPISWISANSTQVISSGRIPLLREFLDGLEPEFRPAPTTLVAAR